MAKQKRNMSLVKVPMPEQDPNVRNKNFFEVASGYTPEMAMEEALRCLQCKHKPCVGGCPVNVRIPEFIAKVAEGDFKEAYEIITSTNNLPAVCGRVCPQESQCEQRCVRAIKGEPVAIGRLERFVADWYMENVDKAIPEIVKNGHKVAVVGSGPAGLTCAGDLAKLGYDVTIYEAFHVPGGVLMYGIPEFRLPKKLVQAEIQGLRDIGVHIETNMVIGRIQSLEELVVDENYEAIFIGTGAGLPTFMRIEGENLNEVYSANEFLTRINLMRAYDWPNAKTPINIGKRVAVIGGGNVAMDAARSAKRLGAEHVYIIYRRSEEELPARAEEVHHAKEEGIEFMLLNNPVRIVDDGRGWVKGIELVKMELGEPDESGRRRPQAIPGSEHIVDLESVIIAIGQSPNPLIKDTTPDLECASWGGIIVDEASMKTSKDGVYAGGDAVTGAATVILAMGAGKTAAKSIDEYIKAKHA
ncbi:MAG: NADPH-dependent glutamate synthase [Eubacteriales bacterium]|nr:NADPH-dependent glutamate synthase [Eubacteriales bacterium]